MEDKRIPTLFKYIKKVNLLMPNDKKLRLSIFRDKYSDSDSYTLLEDNTTLNAEGELESFYACMIANFYDLDSAYNFCMKYFLEIINGKGNNNEI